MGKDKIKKQSGDKIMGSIEDKIPAQQIKNNKAIFIETAEAKIFFVLKIFRRENF